MIKESVVIIGLTVLFSLLGSSLISISKPLQSFSSRQILIANSSNELLTLAEISRFYSSVYIDQKFPVTHSIANAIRLIQKFDRLADYHESNYKIIRPTFAQITKLKPLVGKNISGPCDWLKITKIIESVQIISVSNTTNYCDFVISQQLFRKLEQQYQQSSNIHQNIGEIKQSDQQAIKGQNIFAQNTNLQSELQENRQQEYKQSVILQQQHKIQQQINSIQNQTLKLSYIPTIYEQTIKNETVQKKENYVLLPKLQQNIHPQQANDSKPPFIPFSISDQSVNQHNTSQLNEERKTQDNQQIHTVIINQQPIIQTKPEQYLQSVVEPLTLAIINSYKKGLLKKKQNSQQTIQEFQLQQNAEKNNQEVDQSELQTVEEEEEEVEETAKQGQNNQINEDINNNIV